MTAYASLLSLGHILDKLLEHPSRQMAILDKAQIDSLLQNITFLQDFLEEFSLTRGDEIHELEEKIARSAYAAEDIIERHVADQIFEDSEAGSESRFTLFRQNFEKVVKKFDTMKKDVMKIKNTEGIKIVENFRKAAAEDIIGSRVVDQILPDSKAERSRGASNSKTTMVGFDDDLIQIMEKLTGYESKLQIVSIFGMGGIGKTTLARNVYHHPCIVEHFDVYAWITISQQYSVREILLALLKDIRVRKEEEPKEINKLTNENLGEQLYKSLFGRKYLIVMDDVWSTKCWDDIKRFFPVDDNCSRVMITTRLTNLADDYSSCAPHQLHFLDKDQSWALFCVKVFRKESCPPELEEVGKTIVRNCRGLPLAIVVISGLLAKSNRTVEYWKRVANDTHATLNMGGEGLCFEILSLSFNHLPVHLKSCFLYMAIFPQDHKIKISRLVKLWVAEGMLKPMDSKSLEEIAVDNLKDLIDRNLVMIHDYGSRNKIKTCTIHDLLRDICLTEARKEKFLRVTAKHSLNKCNRIVDNERPFIIKSSSHDKEIFEKLRRVRRKELKMGYIFSIEEIVRLVNSRYIHFRAILFENLLSTLESLSLLWNLQTVIIYGPMPIDLPAEIWEMPQLRHLKRDQGVFNLPDPSRTEIKNGRGDIIVLKSLQTLYKMRNFRCTDEVVHRIPNLKKLGIAYKRFFKRAEFYNLSNLHNLESLIVDSDENVVRNLCFPQSLKKLTLEKCGAYWKDLTLFGSLPHLEVLTVRAVKGPEWKPVEGQFLELKSLRIDSIYLAEWIADSSHFPCLEKLELRFLLTLKEIPQGIGEIPTLGSISLVDCSDSVNSSARKIQEKQQQELGNYDLQLKIKQLNDCEDAMV